jgi:hypothetical protein
MLNAGQMVCPLALLGFRPFCCTFSEYNHGQGHRLSGLARLLTGLGAAPGDELRLQSAGADAARASLVKAGSGSDAQASGLE